MQRLTQALVPDDPESGGDHQGALMDEVSGIGMPGQGLNIDQPAAYQAGPFPSPKPQEASGVATPDAEGPVLRAARALAEVKLRADESGFLKRRGQQATPSEPQMTTVPPVFGSGAENSATPVIATGAFEVPQGPLRVRLDAFALWAMQLIQASRIVIVDGQGYPLLHRDSVKGSIEGDSAMVDSAMRLTSVLEQVQARTDFARDGAMNLPLEEGGWLGVLRCENAGGRLCIAVVTPVPLEIENSASMKNELTRTMAAGTIDNG